VYKRYKKTNDLNNQGYNPEISESLRKYPPVGGLSRVTSKDYTLPGTNFTMPKGMPVFIPIEGFHHNPEFFPNPKSYDPDRFTPEQEAIRNPYSYLPFGEGPRNCIGMRFGMMQAQIGLALLLKSFQFEVSEKTKIPLKFSAKTKLLNVEGGVWLKVSKI
jgi:cytochrome P450 family 6